MDRAHGEIWWNELLCRDVAKATRFYSEILGWEWDELTGPEGIGTYHLGLHQGRPVAGCTKISTVLRGSDARSLWISYMAVDDLQDALAQAEECGGTLLRPTFEVPEFGTIGLLQDLTGSPVGLIQPAATN